LALSITLLVGSSGSAANLTETMECVQAIAKIVGWSQARDSSNKDAGFVEADQTTTWIFAPKSGVWSAHRIKNPSGSVSLALPDGRRFPFTYNTRSDTQQSPQLSQAHDPKVNSGFPRVNVTEIDNDKGSQFIQEELRQRLEGWKQKPMTERIRNYQLTPKKIDGYLKGDKAKCDLVDSPDSLVELLADFAGELEKLGGGTAPSASTARNANPGNGSGRNATATTPGNEGRRNSSSTSDGAGKKKDAHDGGDEPN